MKRHRCPWIGMVRNASHESATTCFPSARGLNLGSDCTEQDATPILLTQAGWGTADIIARRRYFVRRLITS